MKIPIIRHLYQSQPAENLQAALEVLESFTESRGTTENDINVAGELITNICGALEVHEQVANGSTERDALNAFAQRVVGAIDQ
ncbi:MAG: hypothetical protein Q4F57_10160 [Weeksellaceae bacterium]|nr:hypothetical protein [Weeksellaceae bacterium]